MKYIILISSVLIQACIGGLYAWSAFVPALTKTYGLSTAQTQLVFGTLIAVFTASMVVAGRLLNRFGPRWLAMFGGVAFAAGYWLASQSDGNFGLMFIGISIVTGIGTGFCYVCPLTMCAKWFPDSKGFVTGIAVAGFGGGAVILSYLGEYMLSQELSVLDVFKTISIIYGAIIIAASFALKMPDGESANRPPIEFGLITRDLYFWGLALGMFSGTFAGLLVIGNLKPMILSAGISPSIATLAISVFALGNAFGRISWGWVIDKHGAITIPMSLIFLATMIFLAWMFMKTPTGVIVFSALLGIGFGGCFIVYAAHTASHYGADHLGAIYPLIFLAYGISGLVGPWFGGVIYDQTGSYSGGLLLSLMILVISIGGIYPLLGFLKKGYIAHKEGVQYE